MSSCAPSTDVIVIGAGVVGLATAVELLRQGLRVKVLERGAVGRGGASWAGGGILFPLDPGDVNADVRALLAESLHGYAAWCALLAQRSGIDPEYLPSGLQVREPFDLDAWSTLAADAGLALRRAQGHADIPGVAQVRSPRLLRALAGSVRALGGELLEHTAVTGWLDAGRGVGVRTADAVHLAHTVVLACGAWTRELSAQAPIEPVRGQMLLIDAQPGEVERIVLAQRRYLIPRRDGAVLVGSTVERVGFDDQSTAQGRTQLLDTLAHLAPALARRRVLAHWSGLRPAPAGDAPILEWSRERAGVLINTGHYRIGITLAPASARRAAAMILAAR